MNPVEGFKLKVDKMKADADALEKELNSGVHSHAYYEERMKEINSMREQLKVFSYIFGESEEDDPEGEEDE